MKIERILEPKEFTFEEALKFFRGKVPLTRQQFYKLQEEYRGLAFTISKYNDIEIIKTIQEELEKVIEEGLTKEQFRDNLKVFSETKGWTNYKALTPYQLDNVFRTNIQTAYNVGHFESMTNPTVKSLRPYWQYFAVDDRRTRLTHRAMDGKVFHCDDPVWDIWYPPNGYRCRCTVATLSERQVKERGLAVESKDPKPVEVDGYYVNILPDPKFRNNPAKVKWEPNMDELPDNLKVAYKAKMQEIKKG